MAKTVNAISAAIRRWMLGLWTEEHHARVREWYHPKHWRDDTNRASLDRDVQGRRCHAVRKAWH